MNNEKIKKYFYTLNKNRYFVIKDYVFASAPYIAKQI